MLWLLSVPVVAGGYVVYKSFKKVKKIKSYKVKTVSFFKKKFPVNDKSFDADEKSLPIIKSQITRVINRVNEQDDCKWFAIGKTNRPYKIINDFKGKEIILLAKSNNLEIISDLEKIYTEKYKNTTNRIEISGQMLNPIDKPFYLFLITG